MSNLGNIIQNSQFHHVKIYFLKKKIQKKFSLIFGIIFLLILLLDYGIYYKERSAPPV
jgi:hypothetical protein